MKKLLVSIILSVMLSTVFTDLVFDQTQDSRPLFLTGAASSNQTDTTLKEYFPLHVGDYWEYVQINNPPLEPSTYFWSKVVGDTVMPNGKRYYVKLFAPFSSPERQVTDFIRVDDSLDVYVYTRAVECPDSEYVMFRLGAPDSSLWPICANIAPGGANHMWLQATYDWYYQYLDFNRRPTKSFCPSKVDTISHDTTYCTLAATYYRLAKGIGIAQMVFELTGPADIVGAIINGKKYGQITRVQENYMKTFGQEEHAICVFPNPFNESTSIRFFLPSAEYVSLSLYDMLGKRVKSLVKQKLEAGAHELRLDGRGLSSGLYVIVLRGPNIDRQQRTILLK